MGSAVELEVEYERTLSRVNLAELIRRLEIAVF
jgi:hypothetical protein